MNNKIISLVILVFVLLSCGQEPANKNEILGKEEIATIGNLSPLTSDRGLMLLKAHCYSCHNPQSKSHDDMLAPPMAGIKYNYQNHYPNRIEFIAKMSQFVHQPTKENAAMKGPVRRFGLMPKVPLELEEIQKIIAFIYDNELEIPAWFSEHFEEQHGKPWK